MILPRLHRLSSSSGRFPLYRHIRKLSNGGNESNGIEELVRDSSSPDERVFSQTQEPFLSGTYPSSYKPQSEPSSPRSSNAREENHGNNTCILFPGQGTQFVGMGAKLLEKKSKVPVIGALFERASYILGYDLENLCLEGPEDELNKTVYCQPAIFVSSLAAVESLYDTNPDYVRGCISSAGFSVGEIAALVFSSAISFEDGLRLVKVRAEEMQRCSEEVKSGMMSIFFGRDKDLGLALKVAERWVRENHDIEKPIICNANHLYSESKVIAGHEEALTFIEQNKEDFKIRKVKRIPVSGAFHTSLMEGAVPAFKEALARTRISEPKIPVYSNVDCKIYKSADDIRKKLPLQIVRPVKWEQCMNLMLKYKEEEYIPRVFECGPGRSLSYMLRKINGKVARRTTNVEV